MAFGQPFYNYGQPNYSGMNYNGYQPNYQPSIPMQTQQQMTMQQSQPPVQQQQSAQGFPIREVRFVTSEEAKAYIVFPNSNALLIDSANGMAYLKTADNLGQSFTESFKFYKSNPDGTPIMSKETDEQSKPNMDDFIKKSDLEKFSSIYEEQYAAIMKDIKEIQKELVKVSKDSTNEGDK